MSAEKNPSPKLFNFDDLTSEIERPRQIRIWHSGYDQRPWMTRPEGVVIHHKYGYDPLLQALLSRAGERDKASAQIVVQGSLAYLYAEGFPYRAERFIPVDIYSDEWEPDELTRLALDVRGCFVALGYNVITHPRVLKSSTHIRQVIETGFMTGKQLRKLDDLIATAFGSLSDRDETDSDAEALSRRLEQHKALAEIMKIQAETTKVREEARLAKAETKKSKAETKKSETECLKSAAEAVDKVASTLLKITAGISLLIGSTSIASHASDTIIPTKTIDVKKADRQENIKRLGEFLEKLKAQEAAAEKAAGVE